LRGLVYITPNGRVHWCTVDRRKLLPASVVCFCLFVAGLVVLVAGCSTLAANPQGRKASSTRSASAFETMQTQAIEIAAANSRFIDGVIAAQQTRNLSAQEVGKLLQPSIAISKADAQLAGTLGEIVKYSAGKNPAVRDEAAAMFAKSQTAATVGFPAELATIIKSAGEARKALAIVKIREKREALDGQLDRIVRLAGAINAGLKREGVIK